jgi:hypothetical protein
MCRRWLDRDICRKLEYVKCTQVQKKKEKHRRGQIRYFHITKVTMYGIEMMVGI